MTAPDALQRIIGALDHAGIGYMLTGSFASTHYGAPRSTQDIDIVIAASPAQLRIFIQSLPQNDYYANLDAALEARDNESMFNVIDTKTGWKVDFIICKSRAFSREEFGRRRPVNLFGLSLLVASAEDIIIAKLEWSKRAQSERQLDDVTTILKLRHDVLDRSYINKWVSELDLEQQWSRAQVLAGIPKNN